MDAYARRARLGPVLVAVMPVCLALVAWFDLTAAGIATSAVGSALCLALMFFLGQLGRDRGKRKQADLWAGWGGAPGIRLLRHRESDPDREERERRRRHVEAILATSLPCLSEEEADPRGADSRYQAAVDRLSQLTRDREKFPIVFEENVSYGFRRNLWALKPGGLLLCALSLLAILGSVAYGPQESAFPTARVLVCAGVDVVLLVLWVFRITRAWVKLVADAYARQLLLAAERLPVAPESESRVALPRARR